MIGRYILQGHTTVPEPDLSKWAKWFDANFMNRHVAQTFLPDGRWVSTVFLGLDHSFLVNGPPLLFETMVFPKPQGNLARFVSRWLWKYFKLDYFPNNDSVELYSKRYSTWDEAEAGHNEVLRRLKNGEPL